MKDSYCDLKGGAAEGRVEVKRDRNTAGQVFSSNQERVVFLKRLY